MRQAFLFWRFGVRVVVEWDGGGIEKVFLWGFALLCKVGCFGGKMGSGVGVIWA